MADRLRGMTFHAKGMVFGGILSDETYCTDCGSYAEAAF